MTRAPGHLRFDHDHVVSHEERYEAGRAARSRLPRSSQAEYVPDASRDPLGVLDQQHARRLRDLVPLRIARMLQDPFAFYRGTAAIQAADLAGLPTTGTDVVICGDAHIANFGLFASPERSMVFDLNDFDEATTGPWEWDLKRLVASVVIAARGRGSSERFVHDSAMHAARSYRDSLHRSLAVGVTERFFRPAIVRGDGQFGKATRRVVNDLIAASEKRTSERVIGRITKRADDGSLHLVESPPRLTHVSPELEASVGEVLARYSRTVSSDIALLLSQHTVTDVARRVVGVGSVGTRCFIVVLTGPRGEPLILQIKEATDSVVQEFGRVPREVVPGIDPERLAEHHGYRVTAKQRILQAVSDPFLGYVTFEGFGFYVRQFRDRNVSFDIDRMSDQTFLDYGYACGSVLARAHSRSVGGSFIAGYIGHGEVLPEAVTTWACAYADQSLADYEELRASVAAGRYEVAPL